MTYLRWSASKSGNPCQRQSKLTITIDIGSRDIVWPVIPAFSHTTPRASWAICLWARTIAHLLHKVSCNRNINYKIIVHFLLSLLAPTVNLLAWSLHCAISTLLAVALHLHQGSRHGPALRQSSSPADLNRAQQAQEDQEALSTRARHFLLLAQQHYELAGNIMANVGTVMVIRRRKLDRAR